MTNSFKVALLQLLPMENQEQNLNKGLEACRRAKDMGADLAVFPEMWNIGYKIPAEQDELNLSAIAHDGSFVQSFASLARELEMAIAITFWKSMKPHRETPSAFSTNSGI